jgi:protein-S-isoprenylcysteine O-methyltransferase Ste14
MPLLRSAGWIVCLIYSTIPLFWILIHSRVRFWRSRRYSPYFILLPVWIGMWCAMAILTWPWRGVLLYSTPWTWLPATVLFAEGFWVYRLGARNFSGRQLGGVPEMSSSPQALVISGIRARVRHPVYLGHLCELLAWSLGTGLAVTYGLTAFAMVTGFLMIHLEEKELEQRFGDAYRAYRQQVPALIPTWRASA